VRNKLRPPAEVRRLEGLIQRVADTLADAEHLNERTRQAQLEKQSPQDVGDGPRWMPASTMALACGVSLFIWGVVIWIVASLGN
jgi:hypothetical protein